MTRTRRALILLGWLAVVVVLTVLVLTLRAEGTRG